MHKVPRAVGSTRAFGLSFQAHDNCQIQHILHAYGHLPENPNHRASLYLALVDLEKPLSNEDAQVIRDWFRDGGTLSEFSQPSAAQGSPLNRADQPGAWVTILECSW